jgi:hypothetical protein
VQVHITSQKTACETLVLPEKKMADSGEKSIATPSLAL